MSTLATKIVPAADQGRFLHHASISTSLVASKTSDDVYAFNRLLTVGEVATILRVHPNRVYELAARRALPAVRVGRLLRFHLDTLQNWIRSGGTQNAEMQCATEHTARRG